MEIRAEDSISIKGFKSSLNEIVWNRFEYLILATRQSSRNDDVYGWPPHQSYELTEELKNSNDTLRPLDSSLPRRSCGRMLKVS